MQPHYKQEQINSAIDFEGQIHITYEKWLCIQSKKIKEETLRRTKRFFEVFLLPHFSKYDKNRDIVSFLNTNEVTHRDIINIVIRYKKTRTPDLARRFFGVLRISRNMHLMLAYLKIILYLTLLSLKFYFQLSKITTLKLLMKKYWGNF